MGQDETCSMMTVETTYTSLEAVQSRNVIYDVTTPMRNILEGRTHQQCNESLQRSGYQLSSQVFFTAVFRNSSSVPNNIVEQFYNSIPYAEGSPKFMLMFSPTYTCSLHKFLSNNSVENYPSALLVELESSPPNSTDDCVRMNGIFKTNYTIPGFQKLKIGLVGNEQSFGCILKGGVYVKILDIIVYTINASMFATEWSFGAFYRKMSQIFRDTKGRLQEIAPYSVFYIKLSFNDHFICKSVSDSNPHKYVYMATLARYAQAWVKNEKDAKIIIDSYPTSVPYKPTLKAKLKNISPYLEEKWSKIRIATPEELNSLKKLILPNFQNATIVYSKKSASYAANSNGCRHNCTPSVVYDAVRSIPVNVIVQTAPVTSIMIAIVENATNDLILETLYLEHPFYPNATHIDAMWAVAAERNISVGCVESFSFSRHPNKTHRHGLTKSCSKYLRKFSTPKLILECRSEVDGSDPNDLAVIFDFAQKFRHNFTREFPKGQFRLKVNMMDILRTNAYSTFRDNLYCSPRLEQIKEFQDALATLAVLHGFELIGPSLLDTPHTTGWWYNIDTDDELNRTTTKFPVIVRRNAPIAIDENNKFPFTYPCIHKTGTVGSGISFEDNEYSGITVNLGLRTTPKLSVQEIQTLLLFTLGRFASVELVNSEAQIYQLLKAPDKEFTDALKPRIVDVRQLKMFLEFTNLETIELYSKYFNDNEIISLGIHLSGWEGQNLVTRRKFNDALNNRNVTAKRMLFGITVQDCTKEINMGLLRLNSLTYFPFAKYIVCVVSPVVPTNSNETVMQLYLDTHFYIQRYFKTFLRVETFFRLSFRTTKAEHYLRFLNDTNQYSSGYKVRYFMGNAFANKNEKSMSWWKLSDDTDLTKASSYSETESDYFGRPTEQRFKLNQSGNKNIPLVVISLSVSVVFLVALISLWIYHRRMKKSFLTKQELAAFREGEEVQRTEECIGAEHIQTNTIKTVRFDSRFEIPKKNIELVSVVGQGNFGLVYKAVLKADAKVAVKIPHADCSKETFKSILSEVKILCYIGSHPNVISFIGAYTREICAGVIYVVTEFASNGSLERHLRKLRPKQKTAEGAASQNYVGYVSNNDMVMAEIEESVDLPKLYRFAYEIACGMDYISKRKVVHGDLSARNVLLTENMTCKIGDFGLSRRLYKTNEYIKKGEEALPWRWMAIESLKRMEFTSKSDVWSFGVTVWEIFSLGDTPYPGISWDAEFSNKLENGLRMSKPALASDEIYATMLECWNITPETRPTFHEISFFLATLRDRDLFIEG